MTTVVVASFFEEEYVERIRNVDRSLRVLYREDLVPPPRWPGDHVGPDDWDLAPEEDEEFKKMLADAEVLYDFPRKHGRDLTEVAPNLRWLQGSMAGAGEVAQKAGLQDTDVTVTTASGIFSGPLAEFAMMALLQHAKNLDRLQSDKESKAWNQGSVGTLEGKTLCIVGLGNIGREVATRARPFGMRVLGVKRTVRDGDEAWKHADELYTIERLDDVLSGADYVVATLPGTPETHRLLDQQAIRSIKPGAYLVNIGRGSVVDEAAMVDALRREHLAGAALDVFETEPLPQDSPLWELPNVIISPHSTDVVPEQINERQTALFCENLRRYVAGESLLNVLNKQLLY
ncbi:D-2-hydroxyacid dehydrogenase [soil metagenome]